MLFNMIWIWNFGIFLQVWYPHYRCTIYTVSCPLCWFSCSMSQMIIRHSKRHSKESTFSKSILTQRAMHEDYNQHSYCCCCSGFPLAIAISPFCQKIKDLAGGEKANLLFSQVEILLLLFHCYNIVKCIASIGWFIGTVHIKFHSLLKIV